MQFWWLVFQREYLSRVKKAWFWITTLLIPLGIVLMMLLPALIGYVSSQSETSLAVVDKTETLPDVLPQKTDQFTFEYPNRSLEDLKNTLKDDPWQGILYIPSEGIDNPQSLRYISDSNLPVNKRTALTELLTKNIRTVRYKQAGLNQDRIQALEPNVALETVTLGQNQSTSSLAAYLFGFGAGFFMYFLLFIYGQMVMRSVLEEKKNKLVDLVVSSVSPLALMFGKITSIIAISLTQIFIWLSLITLALQGLQATPGLNQANIGGLGNLFDEIGQIAVVPFVSLFLVLFIGGYFLYASLSAMIAAGADEESDVQQAQPIILFPLIISLFVMLSATQNPTGGVAFWGSIIPFSSPLVMLARFPFQVSLWEIGLAILLLYGFGLVVVWLAARVYRVGILIYGQRPGPRQILKWMLRPQ